MAIDQSRWDAWRREDYSWAGLAKKEWKGFSVTPEGLVVETQSGALYRLPSPESPANGGGAGVGETGAIPQTPPPNLRPATLQDYWRADPATGRLRSDAVLIEVGELILRPVPGAAAPPPPSSQGAGHNNGGEGAAAPEMPPETYHIAHLPLAYGDRTETGKANWPQDHLNPLLSARLGAAGETTWEGSYYSRKLTSPDRRAQFDGAVLLAFNAQDLLPAREGKLSLTCKSVFFVGHCFCNSRTFLGDADFTSAAFAGDAGFNDAAFAGDAWFNDAAFAGVAWFNDAAFAGDAGFNDAAFAGVAGFKDAAFAGDAGFNDAAFAGVAGFVRAAFAGVAGFVRATFAGVAGFDDAAFAGVARFDDAAFARDARFDDAAFARDAWFNKAAFAGDAWFDDAAFAGVAGFNKAAFAGVARFNKAAFSGVARFDKAAFIGPVFFQKARFQRTTSFLGQGALLKSPDRKAELTLPKEGENAGVITQEGEITERGRRAFSSANFEGAVFEGDADFSNRDFLEPSSFRDVTFWGLAEFHNSDLHQGQSFHGATFEAPVQQAWPQERQLENLYALAKALAELPRLVKAKPAKLPAYVAWKTAAVATWRKDNRNNDHYLFARPLTHDKRYEKIENAFRTLKLAMEENRNRTEEQFFYRLELQARRRRTDVAAWEQWVSDRYAGWSDYGNSLARPFNRLLAAVVLFACVYWLWGALQPAGTLATPDFWDALTFSFGRVAPFGPWGDEGDWLKFMDKQGSLIGFLARLIATIQSALALVLAFLFALSVRRRFQIN